MARAVFQIRHYAVDPNINQSKKKRSQERSVQISNSASSLTACLAFSKPKTRGVPDRIEHAFDRITECSSNLSKTSAILWLLLRSISKKILDIPIRFPANQPQQIPFWTGYNSSLSEYKSEFSVVSYAPIIESKPNDMSTVFTTMKRCADMTKAMCQVHSVQTFDQELYAIAKQVEWAIPETFRNHTVRLGGFHTLSCYIAAIGKLWGDGGLKYLLVDSSVYAIGTVDQMLNGKEFNRATRAFVLAYEALRVMVVCLF